MANQAKDDQIQSFREAKDILVTTEVGGEGRNLQFCHQMINYDLPWNPMKIKQRIGRIHRIGQENEVRIYNLLHYIKSQGFDRLIQELFTIPEAVLQVQSTAVVQTEYLLLTCRYLAQSDEQKERLLPLAFNLETGAPVDIYGVELDAAEKEFQNADAGEMFSEEKIRQIIQWVQRRAPVILDAQFQSFRDSMNRRFRRDVVNLEEYYAELKQKMVEKAARPGISDQLIQEREDKIALIPEELQKKKDEDESPPVIRADRVALFVVNVRQGLGNVNHQIENLGRRRRIGIKAGPAVGLGGRHRCISRSEISGAQDGKKSGQGVTGTADGFHGLDAWVLHCFHNPAFPGDVVCFAFHQEICSGIVVPIRASDQIRHLIGLVQNKASCVKRMGCQFIRQERQFTHIRGENVVPGGLTAHLRGIHESCIGNQERPALHGVNGEHEFVVPVHIRLKIVECENRKIKFGQLPFQKSVQLSAAVSSAHITHKKGINFRTGDAFGRFARRSQKRGSTPVYGDIPAIDIQMAAVQTDHAVSQWKLRIRNRTDDAYHFFSSSSKASSRA